MNQQFPSSTSYPIGDVTKRATQRQWNATNVKAITKQLDTALASQQRELPLCIDVSASSSAVPASSAQNKNFSPSPSRFVHPATGVVREISQNNHNNSNSTIQSAATAFLYMTRNNLVNNNKNSNNNNNNSNANYYFASVSPTTNNDDNDDHRFSPSPAVKNRQQPNAANSNTAMMNMNMNSNRSSTTTTSTSPHSSSSSPVRIQWNAPSLDELKNKNNSAANTVSISTVPTSKNNGNISYFVAPSSSASSKTILSPPCSFLSTSSPVPNPSTNIPIQQVRSQKSGHGSVSLSFVQQHQHYLLPNTPSSSATSTHQQHPFPDLLNNNNNSRSTATMKREKVKFQDVMSDPSFFLPVRGGSEHPALDSISIKQIRDAIEECPSKERRMAAQSALKGTMLDRQTSVFGNANNNNHDNNNNNLSSSQLQISKKSPSNERNNEVSTTFVSVTANDNKNRVPTNNSYIGRDKLFSEERQKLVQRKLDVKNTIFQTNNNNDVSNISHPQSGILRSSSLPYYQNNNTNENFADDNHDDDAELDAALAQACEDLEGNAPHNKNGNPPRLVETDVIILPSGKNLMDEL